MGAFTVEVEIGIRISRFYVSLCDRVASAFVYVDIQGVNVTVLNARTELFCKAGLNAWSWVLFWVTKMISI